ITKTADNPNANTGDQIGFTVTLANAGSPQATGVAVTDDLPAGTDVDWTLAGDSDPGWSIVGSPPDQSLTGPDTVDGNASTQADFTNGCLPDDPHGAAFFPYWDDLYTVNSGSGIFSLVTGTAPNRTYYLEWRAQYFPGSGTAHFEWVFHEDNDSLQVIYGSLTSGNGSSTEGVQDAGVPIYDEYGCNGAGGVL